MKKLIVPVAMLGLISFVAAKQPASVTNPSQPNSQSKERGGKKGLKAEASLSGDQEVPPNTSDAEGEFKIQFNCDFTAARFDLEVEAENVLQAHLHCGSAGENGPVIAFLFGLVPGGVDVDGRLASFTITNTNLDAVNADCMAAIGHQVETLEDLADAIAMGEIYANVHTTAFPGGEVRGQLELDDKPTKCGNGNHNDNDNDDDDNENENENDNDNENHDHR